MVFLQSLRYLKPSHFGGTQGAPGQPHLLGADKQIPAEEEGGVGQQAVIKHN